MDRRTFAKLAGLTALGVLGAGTEAGAHDPASDRAPVLGKAVVLEAAELPLAFDSNSGAFVRFASERSNWTIEQRPEPGVSFRMLVSRTKRRDNFILGHKQRATRVEKVDSDTVRIRARHVADRLRSSPDRLYRFSAFYSSILAA